MLPLLFAAWIGAASFDGVSTHVGINRGAHELFLPKPPYNYLVLAGTTSLGIIGTKQLWKTGHKKQAIIWTAIDVGIHCAVSVHNLHQ